jgi:pimeloyl-ACP methyl ester carboxylesterase
MMDFLETTRGIQIAYEVVGEGPLLLLVHGFASNYHTNWVRSRVADRLMGAGYRTAMLDLRGHGHSSRPHDPQAYGPEAFFFDLRTLLDAIGTHQVGMVGYSFGARLVVGYAPRDPRVAAAVLGGVGGKFLGPSSPGSEEEAAEHEATAAAMEAPDPASLAPGRPRRFRIWAEAAGADLAALAALQRCLVSWPHFPLSDLKVPTLVISGDQDDLAGDPQELASLLPNARAAVVPGNHMNAVISPRFAEEVARAMSSLQGGLSWKT